MFLREKGCVLPIEVWHYDELDSKDIALLSKIDKVAVMNMKDYISESLDRDGGKLFSMKAAILLYTNFEEILFLDSDNIAATDPTLLFDSPAFKETGAIFWPGFTIFKLDFWKTKADNPIWQLLELECTNEYEQESGQIMIRKTPQVYKALQLTLYFQRQRGIYSELLLGDKDTFRLAWRILKVPYHMVLLI